MALQDVRSCMNGHLTKVEETLKTNILPRRYIPDIFMLDIPKNATDSELHLLLTVHGTISFSCPLALSFILPNFFPT